MSFDKKFAPIQIMVYAIFQNFFQIIARLFGYPKNPGIPIKSNFNTEIDNRSIFLNQLPLHQTSWPPAQRPETFFEMVFGDLPKLETVPRYIYESKKEGFYNFYLENYRNIYFLPDWFSEFLQVRLNICLDITLLETIREILFVGLVIFSQMLLLRISLSWFLSINPHQFPWYYFAATVDWAEELLQGAVPSLLGINITGGAVLGMLGIAGDNLNHLVFTMPFLPSEGEESQLWINQKMTDVVIFHYLPVLWYRYPIPNQIRKFWYEERPDILNYLQKAYHGLNIQFLPDHILEKLNQQNYSTNLTIDSKILKISINSIFDNDIFLMNSNSIHQQFHSLFLASIDIVL